MTRSAEQLLRSQYFYAGARIAFGLLAIALGVYSVAGLHAAVIAASGGMCARVTDTISPSAHKNRELLAGWLVSSGAYLLIGLMRPMPGLLGLFILFFSFMIAMAAVYGPKAGPIGFAGTFAMIMAFGLPPETTSELMPAVGYFTLGGAFYVLYGAVSDHFLAFRTKQQMLAECSFELARYLRIKASFYEKGALLDDLYRDLLRQQSVLATRQQETREFLFRDLKTDRDLRLAEVFIRQVDFFEHILAGNTDYELLQAHYSGGDVMLFLRDLIYKCAGGIEHVAYTALRNTQLPYDLSYKAEIFAARHELERLKWEQGRDQSALDTLEDVYDLIVIFTEMVDEMRRVQNDPAYKCDAALSIKLSLFTTSFNYSLGLFFKNLNLNSPHFRYALRAAIAMELGYLAAIAPHFFFPNMPVHSYWIILNISVVLRTNFSMTAQRRTERIYGSVLGCFLTSIILYWSPPIGVLLICLFLVQTGITTFLTIDYRITSACATILTLLQIHLLEPSVGFALGERLFDTCVGALLAYVCCFIFPSWEYSGLPKLINSLARANAKYTRVVLGCLNMDEEYRLARRSVLNAVSELHATLERMLLEPKNKRRAFRTVARFATLNYLFAGRIASVRILLTRLSGSDAQNVLRPELEEAMNKMARLLSIADESGAATEKCLPSGGGDGETVHLYLDDSVANALHNMDYFVQHAVESLHKQLDAALALAGEIQTLRIALDEKFHV